jgi:serine/threonine protein kinase
MAEVFKACYYQEDGKPAFAAIKRILPHLAQDPSFVEMFLSEATTAGRLQHPGIAQIIEQGEEEGEYFISMEYISGRDLLYLRHHLRERGMLLSPALSAHVISIVADALDYAHALQDEAGRHLEIIHRDVSPQNILISYEGQVKLIDFGIAKAKDRGYEATKAGVLKGKFGYMAPEQIRGKEADHRLDIFSLGVVLYELLTNQRLFLGENDLETLEMVREAKVSAPSLVNKWVSPELDRITLRALHVEPEQRYQRAGELARDLRLFIQQNAPSTSEATLKTWMYQEFSNYIAHEQAQESHILDQLRYQDESVSEQTVETSGQALQELIASVPAQPDSEDTEPPQAQGPEAQGFNFRTEAYQAVAISPFQSDDVPTRPVSAEVFKDLQSRGYQLPDGVYAVETEAQSAPEAMKRTHALEAHEVEELLDGSFEDISMGEDDLLDELTPTDELDGPTNASPEQARSGLRLSALPSSHAKSPAELLEQTAPITKEERDAVFAFGQQQRAQETDGRSPFSTLPLFSDHSSASSLAQAEPEPQLHEREEPLETAPNDLPLEVQALRAQLSEPAAGHDVALETTRPQRGLDRLHDEERERADEVTGPGAEAVGFGARSQLKLPIKAPPLKLIALVALTLSALAALFVLDLSFLKSPLELSIRVMPRDQLTVIKRLEGSEEQREEGPLKSPIKLELSSPMSLSIQREGFEPYRLELDPSDEALSSGTVRVELSPLFPKVDLSVSSIPPGAMVWINGEQLSQQTPIRQLTVTPNDLGEVKVRVQARGDSQEQVKLVQKGQSSPQKLKFAFMLQ